MTSERFTEIREALAAASSKDQSEHPVTDFLGGLFDDGPNVAAFKATLAPGEYEEYGRILDTKYAQKHATDMGGWSTY